MLRDHESKASHRCPSIDKILDAIKFGYTVDSEHEMSQ